MTCRFQPRLTDRTYPRCCEGDRLLPALFLLELGHGMFECGLAHDSVRSHQLSDLRSLMQAAIMLVTGASTAVGFGKVTHRTHVSDNSLIFEVVDLVMTSVLHEPGVWRAAKLRAEINTEIFPQRKDEVLIARFLNEGDRLDFDYRMQLFVHHANRVSIR